MGSCGSRIFKNKVESELISKAIDQPEPKSQLELTPVVHNDLEDIEGFQTDALQMLLLLLYMSAFLGMWTLKFMMIPTGDHRSMWPATPTVMREEDEFASGVRLGQFTSKDKKFRYFRFNPLIPQCLSDLRYDDNKAYADTDNRTIDLDDWEQAKLFANVNRKWYHYDGKEVTTVLEKCLCLCGSWLDGSLKHCDEIFLHCVPFALLNETTVTNLLLRDAPEHSELFLLIGM